MAGLLNELEHAAVVVFSGAAEEPGYPAIRQLGPSVKRADCDAPTAPVSLLAAPDQAGTARDLENLAGEQGLLLFLSRSADW